MKAEHVDMYLISNGRYFEGHHIPSIREMLLKVDESCFAYLHSINLKDPNMMLLVSLLVGGLGVDRFMVGDTGLGIAKLLTCGGFGIWAIVDLFFIMGRTRESNTQRLTNALFY